MGLKSFSWVPAVSASELSFQEVYRSDEEEPMQTVLSVHVDTLGALVNAIEGTVMIPEGLEVVFIDEGDSIIDFWLEKPEWSSDTNQIEFAGVIIGGFKGPGELFALSLEYPPSFTGELEWGTSKVLLHDGKATPDSVTAISYSFEKKTSMLGEKEEEDNVPPEPFTLTLTQDPQLFEGQYVLIFETQDKQSGIDHYEVQEGNSIFERAESPYVLKNQDDLFNITVRAVDKAGNIREETLESPTSWLPILLLILVVGASLVFLFRNRGRGLRT